MNTQRSAILKQKAGSALSRRIIKKLSAKKDERGKPMTRPRIIFLALLTALIASISAAAVSYAADQKIKAKVPGIT